MHIFKVQLDLSDMFIYNIDVDKKLITYEVREKDNGHLLEPRHNAPLEFYPDKVYFDNRFLTSDLFKHVYFILMLDTPALVSKPVTTT
jgi:hypothetical protein